MEPDMPKRKSYVHADFIGLHEHSDADANTYRHCPCGKPDCDTHLHRHPNGYISTHQHADGRTRHGLVDVDADRDEHPGHPAEPNRNADA